MRVCLLQPRGDEPATTGHRAGEHRFGHVNGGGADQHVPAYLLGGQRHRTGPAGDGVRPFMGGEDDQGDDPPIEQGEPGP